MHESRAHIHAPYGGSRGIDIHPVDYQVRQCKTSADRGEDALADLEVDAKAPLQPSPQSPLPLFLNLNLNPNYIRWFLRTNLPWKADRITCDR